MDASTPHAVSLEALSERQKALVARHLPLVHLTLSRMPVRRRPRGPDRAELVQEGVMALAEAIRKHDPQRHGPFAPYVMSRVHFAISRYLHEQTGVVRVPYITQRRRRAAEARGDRHRPDEAPRLPRDAGDRLDPRYGVPERGAEGMLASQNAVTVGDLLAARLRRAAEAVLEEMKQTGRRSADRAEVVERCYAERWSVPEPEARTPIRRLARELNSSLGRLTQCEARFHRLVARRLAADPVFARLRARARSSPEGCRQTLSEGEFASFEGEH